MMTRIIRQGLTAILLLLFSSENVAIASIFQEETDAAAVHQHAYVQQEIQIVFSILAEENEERDERDDLILPFERDVLHPYHFPIISNKKNSKYGDSNSVVRNVPIYTYHCTLII
jgi:hypothetical protein